MSQLVDAWGTPTNEPEDEGEVEARQRSREDRETYLRLNGALPDTPTSPACVLCGGTYVRVEGQQCTGCGDYCETAEQSSRNTQAIVGASTSPASVGERPQLREFLRDTMGALLNAETPEDEEARLEEAVDQLATLRGAPSERTVKGRLFTAEEMLRGVHEITRKDAERIRELEREVERLGGTAPSERERELERQFWAQQVVQEHRRTIEECARVAEGFAAQHDHMAAAVARAIRALSTTQEDTNHG